MIFREWGVVGDGGGWDGLCVVVSSSLHNPTSDMIVERGSVLPRNSLGLNGVNRVILEKINKEIPFYKSQSFVMFGEGKYKREGIAIPWNLDMIIGLNQTCTLFLIICIKYPPIHTVRTPPLTNLPSESAHAWNRHLSIVQQLYMIWLQAHSQAYVSASTSFCKDEKRERERESEREREREPDLNRDRSGQLVSENMDHVTVNLI